MFNQQPQNNLPVSADGVDERMYLAGLPTSNNAVPQVQVSPEMNGFVGFIAGWVRKALQDNAEKNNFRAFLFNLCAENNFINQDFARLIVTTSELAEYYLTTGQTTGEMAVQRAAAEVCEIESAMMVTRYPPLERYITSPVTQRDIQAAIQNAAKIENMLTQWMAQRVQQSNMGGFPQQTGGFNRGNNMNNEWQGNPMFPTQNQNQFPQRGVPLMGSQNNNYNTAGGMNRNYGAQGVQGQFTQQPAPTSPVSNYDGRRRGSAPKPKIVEEFGGERDKIMPGMNYHSRSNRTQQPPDQQPKSTPYQPPTPQVDKFDAPEPSMFTPQNENIQKIPVRFADFEGYTLTQDPERLFDRVYLYQPDDRNGPLIEMRPAYNSGWTVTFSEDGNYPAMYKLSTHTKFHVLDRGVVSEIIVETTDQMEYINHELRHDLRRNKAPNDGKRVMPRWDIVGRMNPNVPGEGEDATKVNPIVEMEEDGKAVVLPDVLIGNTLAESEMKFQFAMTAHGVDDSHGMPCEYYAQLVDPVYTNQSTHMGLLKKLSSVETLFAMAEEMSDQFEIDNSAFWYKLDERLTNGVNNVLSKNLNLGEWSITSFTDDYCDLLESLNETYSDTIVAMVEKTSKVVIRNACNTLNGEGAAEYYKMITVNDDEPIMSFDEFLNRVVLFSDMCSVTYLPWRLEDIDMLITDEPVLIREATDHDLYVATKGIAKRTNVMLNTFQHHYLITQDLVKLELHKGYLSKGACLISTTN